jgi:Zn finger protein HypA/HybF involved in hydrogenase expression
VKNVDPLIWIGESVVSASSNLWLEAGITLGNDPSAIVKCPDCRKADLAVEDIPIAWQNPKIERQMKCPACGSHNYLLMKKPSN